MDFYKSFISNFITPYALVYFKFCIYLRSSYSEILSFFIIPINKFLFSLFIIFAFFFSSLTISEVFEDYIANEKIKNVANRLLYISAIGISFLTIIIIFNLK